MVLELGKVQHIWGLATEGRAAIEATRRGLPISTVDELVDSGRLSLAEIDRIVLPRKTWRIVARSARSLRISRTV